MSESGLILILAVLVLGGIIATVGDRIGTKVGKARLSLFNLRPRNTATLITILTGVVVAASTLGILLATSGPLRKGLFELERIQRDLRRTKGALANINQELLTARGQKVTTEAELAKTRAERAQAQKLLTATNKSLQQAYADRDRANTTRQQAQAELDINQQQLAAVSAQATALRSNIAQLQTERQRVITESEAELRAKIIEIQAKTAVIQEREKQVQNLEAQQAFLAREIARLEQTAEGLRLGNVAIQRGQVLSSAVLRIENPTAAQSGVDQLLREANRMANQLARPGNGRKDQVILITRANVEQLVNQIDDGQDYVVRVLAAANYLTGEIPIQVVTEAVQNRVLFEAGEMVASSSLNPGEMSDAEIQQRINLLLAAASFRARRIGILTDSVEIGRVQNLITFIEKLKAFDRTLEVRAVAAERTYTAGPLTVQFEALDQGEVVLRSQT